MQYKFPFRVGITGHRNVTSTEKPYVLDQISNALDSIKNQIESERSQLNIKSSFYISGISPLAEGVDRIFAEAVLNMGGRLEVILPFRKEIYKKDFGSVASKEEFDSLLEFDQYPLVIDATDQPHKEWAYFHAGKLVVDQCDILIAVWDGENARGRGGTKSIIDYANKNNVPTITIIQNAEAPTDYSNISKINISEYKSFDKVLAEAQTTNIPSDGNIQSFGALKNSIGVVNFAKLSDIIKTYLYWDLSAIRHQKSHTRLIYLLYAFAALASVTGILTFLTEMIHGESESQFGFHILDGMVLLSVILWYQYIRTSSKHKKWIQSRIWAEKTRIYIFKAICLKSTNEIMDNNFRLTLFQNKSWHGRLFLSIVKHIKMDASSELSVDQRRDIIRSGFVMDQLNYQKNKQIRNKTLVHRFTLLSLFFLGIAVICVTGEIASDHLIKPVDLIRLRVFHEIFGSVLVLLPVIGALIEGLKGIVDYEKSYIINKSMSIRLNGILDDLDNFCNTEEDLGKIFERIESVLLYENNEWTMLVKEPELAF